MKSWGPRKASAGELGGEIGMASEGAGPDRGPVPQAILTAVGDLHCGRNSAAALHSLFAQLDPRANAGSSRLEEPLNRYEVTAGFHGHAHHGSSVGRTAGGAPVYNVALPLLRALQLDRPPFKLVQLPVLEHERQPGSPRDAEPEAVEGAIHN